MGMVACLSAVLFALMLQVQWCKAALYRPERSLGADSHTFAPVQVGAQAPSISPASSEDIVLKDLIVLCPINSTTEVQSLSIQSMEPTDTTMQTSTKYAGYMYQSVNALGGLTTCTGTESPITAGKAP